MNCWHSLILFWYRITHTHTRIHAHTHKHTHCHLSLSEKTTRHNYRGGPRSQSHTLMKVRFPPPAGKKCSTWLHLRDNYTVTIKGSGFWALCHGHLGGANHHSSLSRCVTEVLNPPFVLRITCPSMELLGVTLQALRWPHFQRKGPGAPEGMRAAGPTN